MGYRLKVTLDISHHVVVAERLLNSGPDDDKLLTEIIPRVCLLPF